MAEAIARSLLGNSTVVESAGLDAVEGDCANKKAVAAMKEMGLNVEPHRTRNIRSINANNYDLVVAMSPSIGRRLRELGVESHRIAELNVPDPFGTDVDEYRSTAKLIENELQRLFNNPPIDSRGKGDAMNDLRIQELERQAEECEEWAEQFLKHKVVLKVNGAEIYSPDEMARKYREYAAAYRELIALYRSAGRPAPTVAVPQREETRPDRTSRLKK